MFGEHCDVTFITYFARYNGHTHSVERSGYDEQCACYGTVWEEISVEEPADADADAGADEEIVRLSGLDFRNQRLFRVLHVPVIHTRGGISPCDWLEYRSCRCRGSGAEEGRRQATCISDSKPSIRSQMPCLLSRSSHPS